MLYKLIEKKRDQWYASKECTIRELIAYISDRGIMRDAQIEAIKTFLFLKISGANKPLWQLFVDGFFTTLSLDELEVTKSTRELLDRTPAALALLEYSTLVIAEGRTLAPDLEKAIKSGNNSIDYTEVFKDIFYNVPYSDYLFSLPMGAGKTYLMAAFIYLELYFAISEPENMAFAKNFMIFAPSGLKSSVVPSLKTIKDFDPTWVLPEPAASEIKGLLSFEVLDEDKSKKKSNRAKNPNAQKLNNYHPFEDLIGLVAVTNAEKVILDRVDKVDSQELDLGLEELKKINLANELRRIIGKIPSLSVYIDEVHHAVNEDIILRKVVTQWTQGNKFNSVIGFSGTPYLNKAHTIQVTDELKIKDIEISNVVYYYPLIKGINNFLKIPTVRTTTNNDPLYIVENGTKNFFDRFRDKIYGNGTVAKLGIYCGSIENLEQNIYPVVAKVVESYGLNPNEVILKYHGGNKAYKLTAESKAEFVSLDKPLSKIRVVLLVQIGKEGWDCKSLTGIILSQKGDCPTNMVLQTSCRCLRQVDRGQSEEALIWLNEFNEKSLDTQLKRKQNSSLQEFGNVKNTQPTTLLKRYSRIDHLKLPEIDFYQLKVEFSTLVTEAKNNTVEKLCSSTDDCVIDDIITTKEGFEDKNTTITKEVKGLGDTLSFNQWLYQISKESFGTLAMSELKSHTSQLESIYDAITKDGRLNLSYDHNAVRSNIRKAFAVIRAIQTNEEIVPDTAKLLRIGNMAEFSTIETTVVEKYHPTQAEVEKIISSDRDGAQINNNAEVQKAVQMLRSLGNFEMAAKLEAENTLGSNSQNNTYHYLPYRFDSDFEKLFFSEVLKLDEFKSKGLEIYFNGDRALTDFRIKCYKKLRSSWRYIGKYTPDFLIIKRVEGKIHQAIIVETKGTGYANDRNFTDKKDFMNTFFCKENNSQYGYNRFDYLYLEDGLSDKDRITATIDSINRFFE